MLRIAMFAVALLGISAMNLRTSDGTYFTKAGARKLAWYVEKEIQSIMAARPQVANPPPEPSARAPVDKRAARPDAGPVVPLERFATPSKPEQLLGDDSRNASTGPEIRRADDFTWPRAEAQTPARGLN
jgi:uncharacterized protein